MWFPRLFFLHSLEQRGRVEIEVVNAACVVFEDLEDGAQLICLCPVKVRACPVQQFPPVGVGVVVGQGDVEETLAAL